MISEGEAFLKITKIKLPQEAILTIGYFGILIYNNKKILLLTSNKKKNNISQKNLKS